MKDHPHLRGAAEGYSSLKVGLSAAALFVKDDGAITAKALVQGCSSCALNSAGQEQQQFVFSVEKPSLCR